MHDPCVTANMNIPNILSTDLIEPKPDIGPSAADEKIALPPQTKFARLPFLDGLRCLTALYVVLHHIYWQVWSEHAPPPEGVAIAISQALRFGHAAVAIFIVLSGFSLMLPLARHNYKYPGGIKRFYLKRAVRIIPPYYAALFLSVFLAVTKFSQKLGTHYDMCIPVDPNQVLGCLMFMPEFNTLNGNHAFWSIGLECKIYLLFPLLLWSLAGMGPVFLLSFTSLFGLALWCIVQKTIYLGTFPHFIALFSSGMVASYVVTTIGPQVIRKCKINLLAIAAWIVVGCLLNKCESLNNYAFIDITIGFASMLTLIALSVGELRGLNAICCNKVIAKIGVTSYSIYLIHAPLLQLFSKYVTKRLHLSAIPEFAVFMLLCIPFVIACSYLFYRVFEKPCAERAKTI